jgi:hypothetical protein
LYVILQKEEREEWMEGDSEGERKEKGKEGSSAKDIA